MRTSVRRALAAASALVTSAALVLSTAAPAAAEGSAFCPRDGSVRLLTANSDNIKVWVYQVNGDMHVCFNLDYLLLGDLILRGGSTGTVLPEVVEDPDSRDCLWVFRLQDPAELIVQLDVQPGPTTYFCFGVNFTTIGISITPGSVPIPELWLDYSQIAFELCFVLRGGVGCFDNWPMRVL